MAIEIVQITNDVKGSDKVIGTLQKFYMIEKGHSGYFYVFNDCRGVEGNVLKDV